LANGFARYLAAAGVGAGDRVAVLMGNRVDFVVAVHAVSKLGAASVLLSPAWRAAEVDHAIRLTAPVHAVADAAGTALLGGRIDGGVTDVDIVAAPPLADPPPTRPTASGCSTCSLPRPPARRCDSTPASISRSCCAVSSVTA